MENNMNIGSGKKDLDENEKAMILGSFLNMTPAQDIKRLDNEIKGIKSVLEKVIQMLEELAGGKLDMTNEEDEDVGVASPMSNDVSRDTIQNDMMSTLARQITTPQK